MNETMGQDKDVCVSKNAKPLSIPAASLCLSFGLILGNIGAGIYDAEEHYLVREFKNIEIEQRGVPPLAPEERLIAPSEIA